MKSCSNYIKSKEEDKFIIQFIAEDADSNLISNLIKEKGETTAVLEIRTHFLYYLKGLEGSAEVKNNICKAKSEKEILDILDRYMEGYNGR